jgi:hypothetical protein
MFLIVSAKIIPARAMLRSSHFTGVTSALWIATSAPEPMAGVADVGLG